MKTGPASMGAFLSLGYYVRVSLHVYSLLLRFPSCVLNASGQSWTKLFSERENKKISVKVCFKVKAHWLRESFFFFFLFGLYSVALAFLDIVNSEKASICSMLQLSRQKLV